MGISLSFVYPDSGWVGIYTTGSLEKARERKGDCVLSSVVIFTVALFLICVRSLKLCAIMYFELSDFIGFLRQNSIGFKGLKLYMHTFYVVYV